MVFASECGVLPARASSRFRRISPPEVGPIRDHKQHVGAGKGSQGWLGVIDRALREEKAKMQAERCETARSADPLPPAPTRSYLPGETAPTLLQEAFRKGVRNVVANTKNTRAYIQPPCVCPATL